MEETHLLLHKIIERLDFQSASIEQVQSDVRELRLEFTQLRSDVETLKDDVKTLKSNVEILKADVETLKDDVKDLKSVQLEHGKQLSHHTDLLAQINKGQQRQDKLIETLSIRSLEQETDLRELRNLG